MKPQSFIVIMCIFLMLTGCGTVYYGTMEKLGVHKREILVNRIKAARNTQNEAKEQFLSAMEQFKNVVNFQEGDLENEYRRLNAALRRSESKAEDVRKRIRAVEHVSDALFKEWKQEMVQYSSESLRKSSQQQYDMTEKKYNELIKAMKAAEARLEPALVPLRDQVLFMKHNLNARAIAGLTQELAHVQMNVDLLIFEMESAIAKADSFIESMETK